MWPPASRRTLKPSARSISPRDGAPATTGSPATCTTIPDGASSSALWGPRGGRGAAGKWTDAATGQHGDLLDLIALSLGHTHLRDTLAEARAFLDEPSRIAPRAPQPVPRNSRAAARRLFAASRPLRGTFGETYLRARGITSPLRIPALRFHPNSYYRPHDGAALQTWPALIAAVTDLSGNITGVHRTWLARDGSSRPRLPTRAAPWANCSGTGSGWALSRTFLRQARGSRLCSP